MYAADDEDEESETELVEYETWKDKDGWIIEYGQYGLNNALHLLFIPGNVVNSNLFSFIISQKVNIDAKDYQGFTAFFKIFKNKVKYQPKILETLWKKGVNIDISNEEGFTPFLYTFWS